MEIQTAENNQDMLNKIMLGGLVLILIFIFKLQ